jgi:hypothetical protein
MVEAVNFGGADEAAALALVSMVCDLDRLAAWKGIGAQPLGNCFHATTDAACQLILANVLDGALVTGRFEHPDMDEPVLHAWLEIGRQRSVVNVSGLSERPLYASPRARFYKLNNCSRPLQHLPFRRVLIKMERANRKAGELDIRTFVPVLLAPTLRQLPPAAAGRPGPDHPAPGFNA